MVGKKKWVRGISRVLGGAGGGSALGLGFEMIFLEKKNQKKKKKRQGLNFENPPPTYDLSKSLDLFRMSSGASGLFLRVQV